jgi:hypothetical protein
MRPLGRDNVVSLSEKRNRLALVETPTEVLEAEVDRVDASWERLAMPPELTPGAEAKQLVARHVDEAKSSLLKAGQLCADRDDLISVHARVASVALEVDTLLSDLAGGGEAA